MNLDLNKVPAWLLELLCEEMDIRLLIEDGRVSNYECN